MILSTQSIRKANIFDPFSEETRDENGISYGLGAASYSVRLDQDLELFYRGFGLFSTLEKFKMPDNIAAIVHDKSTWARKGLSVQNTFIDPGFEGFVTLEINYQGPEHRIFIPAGTGIAQLVFHILDETTEKPYRGKYQAQERGPQRAR